MKFLRALIAVPIWFLVGGTVLWLGAKYSGIFAGLLCSAAVLLPFAYVLISTFYPAWGDTKCPRCGKPALQRPDPKVALGVRCTACGFEDPEMYRAYLDEM
ncbi:MAG: hypothetical protein HUU15_11070 [Candidatus Brocadiae bacterium]|nr:hypothetical protein [Candidatus Brocadiia bacterium]